MMPRDLYVQNEPHTTLFPEETNMLIDLVDTAITLFAAGARKGSFILDGQKFGEDAKCILKFNLEDGVYTHVITNPCCRSSWVPSDQLAAGAIDEMLELPQYSNYRMCGLSNNKPFDRSEDAHSGIYVDGCHQVLVVRAEYGRFLCSCYLDPSELDDPPRAHRSVLFAVAQALQLLDPPDAELRNFKIESDPCYDDGSYAQVLRTIRKYVEYRELPSIQKWAAWVEKASAQGKMTRFFK